MLTYGSDCSGIECPSEALCQLGVEFEHAFASEKHRTARRWIENKWQPRRMDKDVTTRDHSSLPRVDLYVAGCPCVAYSGLNVHAFDMQNPSIRDAIAPLEHCLRYIETKRPRAVVLENLPRMKTRGKVVYDDMINRLNKAGYAVHVKELSPDLYGCPQRRPRLFVVGLYRAKHAFEWPAPVPCKTTCLDAIEPNASDLRPPAWMCKKIDSFEVDRDTPGLFSPNYHSFQLLGRNPRVSTKIYDDYSPALVHKQPGLVWNHLGRLLSAREALWLQGITDPPPLDLTDTQVRRMVGNGMNVTLLTHLFASVLRALGHDCTPPPPLPPLRNLLTARSRRPRCSTRSAPPPTSKRRVRTAA